jgi:hypothetical protein
MLWLKLDRFDMTKRRITRLSVLHLSFKLELLISSPVPTSVQLKIHIQGCFQYEARIIMDIQH